MKTLRTLMATVSLMFVLAASSFAQTTLTSTTLAAAVAAGSTQVQVASAAGIEVGDYVAVVNRKAVVEVMQVRAISGVFLTVSRAARLGASPGGLAIASGATVYHAPPGQFFNDTPSGTCTRATQVYLPHINLRDGVISECSPAAVWYRLDQTFIQTCRMLLIADMVDQSCVTIDRDLVLVGATYVSKVVESAGTLTVRIMREQGTEAAASGDLLATAISGVSTVAETVTSYTLSTTGSFLLLSSGERLGVDFTDDVAGELAGVTITFTLAPR
jgi:hypothetical protein